MIQEMNIDELVDLANLVTKSKEEYAHFGITYILLQDSIVALMFTDATKTVKKDVRVNN